MKKNLFALLAIFVVPLFAMATAPDTVNVFNVTVPVMLGENVNPVVDLKVTNTLPSAMLSAVEIEFPSTTPTKYIESMELYYTGTSSMFLSRTRSQALRIHADRFSGGQMIYKHPAYAIPTGGAKVMGSKCVINSTQKLFVGVNYIYVSLKLRKDTPLTATFEPQIKAVKINNQPMPLIEKVAPTPLRVGVSVRNAGNDGVDSYRIPGLATAKDGTLMAVYDIRNTSSTDLQEDIQIGLSCSMDGGRTWKAMQTIIDMRGYGVLPASQNGVGDPAILVDERSGRVWAIALWNYGIGADRGWFNLKQGLTPEEEAAQIVIASSDDNGATWSKPINITSQVKRPEWYITLQGPGRGITMKDGTLVFAFQYVDTNRLPYSTIIYSKDGGKTWASGTGIKSNTTEAQVVELADGELMINARDNRGGSRTVMTSRDMGLTWIEHPSSRSALREPVCMASLYKANYKGQTVLFFSNPNTIKGRHHITIKASTDMGQTWSEGVLLDAEPGWGYSCLTSVDENTLGILYEGSRSEMTFQAIAIADLLK
ncbi:MAG: sialidase family protein [Mucinivorans sp.]